MAMYMKVLELLYTNPLLTLGRYKSLIIQGTCWGLRVPVNPPILDNSIFHKKVPLI